MHLATGIYGDAPHPLFFRTFRCRKVSIENMNFACDDKANQQPPSQHFSHDESENKIASSIQVTNVLQAYVYRALTLASLHLADDGSPFLRFGTVWSLVLF